MPTYSGNKGWLFGVALLLLILAAGFGGWWLLAPVAVASVDESSISEADVAYRIGLEQAYGTAIEHPAALVALIKDALEREVAARIGVIVTEQEMIDFSAGVDKHSKAPEVLKGVKKVFAGNDEAYRRIYLAPKVVNRKLRSWFSRDAATQQKPRAAVQRAYALAAAGNNFKQVAKASGLKFAAQDYKAEQKDAPDALRAYFPKGMTMMTPGFQKLLDGLKPGEMAQTISEDDASYRVVRLLEVSGEKDMRSYKTEEIIAGKEPFDAWFREQSRKVPVRIKDDALRTAIAEKYPKLVWNQSRN